MDQRSQIRDDLITKYLRLARSVAEQFHHRHMDPEDLYQEACVGLTLAAEEFDESKGFQFATYAVWRCRGAILDALRGERRAKG